uniref:solute carrier organic anion transporter family member 5A1-like isoform X2 n=1 Tax=Myxine glutinosa TaxID=7769 RepID=UPI00358E93CB
MADAILYVMGALGPAVGYLMGSWFVSCYVHPNEEGTLTQLDPGFVGNWWSGFLLCAVAILIFSLPIFTFPRSLGPSAAHQPKATDGDEKQEFSDMTCRNVQELNEEAFSLPKSLHFGKEIRDLPRAALHICSNFTFLFVSLAYTAEIAIVTAFITFIPKFLELQFSVPASHANFYTGIIVVPSASIGLLTGGYVIKRLKLSAVGAARMAAICCAISLLPCIGLGLLGCNGINLAGVTEPYASGPSLVQGLQSSCNSHCICPSNLYQPVCGSDGLTYVNPCLAGCSAVFTPITMKGTNFSQCECILSQPSTLEERSSSQLIPGHALLGKCGSVCNSLGLYLALIFVVIMVMTCAQPCALIVTLRSVDQHERPFALGMQFVLLRTLAYIPTPILFGAIIDKTCLFWQQRTAPVWYDGPQGPAGFGRTIGATSSCLEYDVTLLRLVYFGLIAMLKLLGFLFMLLTWWSLRGKHIKAKYTVPSAQTFDGERTNSISPCTLMSVSV